MNVNLLYPMVLAENYEELVDWYVKAFDLTISYRSETEENYTVLQQSGNSVVGIAMAREMGVKPATPRNNTVVIQLSVSDIGILFAKLKNLGGKILFGPSLDEKGGYLYGGLADIEGNTIWIVEK
jgi:predicted enzyme related to lactoylglutathione lyase